MGARHRARFRVRRCSRGGLAGSSPGTGRPPDVRRVLRRFRLPAPQGHGSLGVLPHYRLAAAGGLSVADRLAVASAPDGSASGGPRYFSVSRVR